MNVILAKSAGFCFGVKRAVDTVYERILEKEPLYTFGPIIHNEEVVRDLEEKGVVVVNDVDELAGKPQGTVIIRAHGVERGVCEKIQTLGFSIVDATCPFVLKIHRLVERYSGEDCHIVIVGNASHPEVKGIKSWSNAEDTRVIGTREEAEKYDASHGKKLAIHGLCIYIIIFFFILHQPALVLKHLEIFGSLLIYFRYRFILCRHRR